MEVIKILITHMNSVEKDSFGIKIQKEIESCNGVCIYIQDMLIFCFMRSLNSVRSSPNNKSLKIYTEGKACERARRWH